MRSEARRLIGSLPGTSRMNMERRGRSGVSEGAEMSRLRVWQGREKGCSDYSISLLGHQVEVVSFTEKGK